MNKDINNLKSRFDWQWYVFNYSLPFTTYLDAWNHFKKEGHKNHYMWYNYTNNDITKKILIVMPTYNRSNYLENAISMVTRQLYTNWNLLVIDDGSNPEHKQKFNEIKQNYQTNNKIMFWENETNCNIAKTLNRGIRHFLDNDYDYFTWISDDNDYYPYCFQELVIGNTFFNYCNYLFTRINQDGKNERHCALNYTNMNELLDKWRGMGAFMWTKKAIEQIGYYREDIQGCEDYEYFLRTFNFVSAECKHVPKILMNYILHNDSLFIKENAKILELTNKIREDYRNGVPPSEPTVVTQVLPSEPTVVTQVPPSEPTVVTQVLPSEPTVVTQVPPSEPTVVTYYDLSIIILCFNHLEYTKKCIGSVLENTDNINYNIIIVNNASTDETYDYLDSISLNNELITVVHNENNYGFSKGMNIGVKSSSSRYIILLNNDTIVSKNWDVELINVLKNNDDVYAVTPITNSSGNESRINIDHINEIDFFNQVTKIQSTLLPNFNASSLVLFCGAFRRSDFIDLGYLDESYLNGWEDDDLYEKIIGKQKRVVITTQSVVYHYGSITVGKFAHSDMNNPNKLYFEKKWDKKWSTHRYGSIKNYPREPTPNNIHIYKHIIITGNDDGGSYFWAKDYYKYFKLIKNKIDFKNIIITDKTTLILNSFLLSDITCDFLRSIKDETNCKILVPIHDYYWFCDKHYYIYDIAIHNCYINKTRKTLPHMLELYNLADQFLASTPTILNNIKHLIPQSFLHKFFISSETWSINLKLSREYIVNANTDTNSINIGIFVKIDEYKGLEQVNHLNNTFQNYNGKKINFYIVGKNIPLYENSYKSFVEYINKYQIHGFLLLNKYGETWCYTLDKILISQLPLLYNNVGSFKDRILPNNTKYLINCNDESEYYDFDKLNNNFIKFLDVIQTNNIQSKKNINIPKFAVYFPQFHTIKENNYSFYNEYNDIKNLNICDTTLYNINDISFSKVTPNLDMLKLKNIDEYNLLNDELIATQVSILKEYNFTGVAVYYYWFSQNSITNNNLIMFDTIEKLLNKTIDVFFVWANENWTDNVSFTQKGATHVIKNYYNDDEFKKHCMFLVSCFKHKNYYKIQNKPVFYIHHPWFFDNLILFEQLLNQYCIENGFNGVYLKINDMNTDITEITNNKKHYYSFHPNYKRSTSGIVVNKPTCAAYLNYTDYINKLIFTTNSQCIFFDFDNYARLIKPTKTKYRTKCINNSICNHIKYMDKIIDYYQSIENDESDPFILLFNAFNEWGEKMHIEPSDDYNTYYLDLIATKFN